MSDDSESGQSLRGGLLRSPGNPRPTVFNTRAYGCIGAFCRATLKEGEPLVVRYRLMVRGLPEGAAPELVARTAEGLQREYASLDPPGFFEHPR